MDRRSSRRSEFAAKHSGKANRPKKIPSAKTAIPTNRFPIVGIGASAGGLEAMTQMLEHLPAETGMAFVLVQHLDPTHESALTSLLSRATAMCAEEAKNDGMHSTCAPISPRSRSCSTTSSSTLPAFSAIPRYFKH